MVELVVALAGCVVELESPVPLAVEVCDVAAAGAAAVESVVAGAAVSEAAGGASEELAAG